MTPDRHNQCSVDNTKSLIAWIKRILLNLCLKVRLLSRKEIKGIMPPMITVFKSNEDLDEEGTRAFVNFLIEKGVHGIIPNGSTGEFASLTDEDRQRVIQVVVDEANNRVPVYAGISHNSTRLTIEQGRFAKDVGADGVMIVPPYYCLPTEREVYAHFRAVSEAVDLPIMLYNNPWFSKVDVSHWTIARMFEEGIVSSVKEAHGDPARVHNIIMLTKGKMTVFYGHDVNAFEGLAVGAHGWVSGLGNLIPDKSRQLYDLMTEGKDLEKGRSLWYEILALIHLSTASRTGERTNWLQQIKEGLAMRGHPVGAARRPWLPLEPSERQQLEAILKALKLAK